MNASLPVLPFATDSAGGVSGVDGELHKIQLDSAGQPGFAPLLEQAQAAVSGEFAVAPLTPPDAESLRQQIELLPQAGKLLPLLGQILDQASTNGVEPQQVLQRIAEKLEQLGSNAGPNPAASPVAALYQLLDEMPALKTPAAADAVPFVTAEVKTSAAAPAGDRTTGSSPLPVIHRPTGVAETREKLPVNDVQSDSNNTGLDKALEQARIRQPEPQQTQLASVMAALKRLMVQGKSVSADTQLRAEPVTAAVTSASAQGPSPATSPLATLSVNTPLAQGGWDQALGERIQWMVSQKMQGAQIRLNPAQLGPMEVRIQVQNDQASIQFSSAHSVVREALEAALPRLRDMFDASGVELVDVDVSGQSSAGEQRAGGEDEAVARGPVVIDGGSSAETVLETPVNALLENGRLDLFA